MSRCLCTIASLNYTAQVLTLAESARSQEPDLDFHWLVVDEAPPSLAQEIPPWVQLFPVADLGIADFWKKAIQFDALELNTNVKPRWLIHLLQRYEAVVYLDPDIYLYAPLTPVWESLAQAIVVLTPHCLTPIPDDGHSPDSAGLLAVGPYNLGFIGVKRDTETLDLLAWWDRQCLTQGWNAPHTGVFVDQKWTAVFPCLTDKCAILRHPGCNVAYWNLHERQLPRDCTIRYQDKEYPLVFFHYSGYRPQEPYRLSKYETRFGAVPTSMARLFEDYALALRNHGLARWSKQNYAFAQTPSGTQLSTPARRAAATQLLSRDDLKDGKLDQWLLRTGLGTPGDVQNTKGGPSLAVPLAESEFKKQLIWFCLRMLLRLFGPTRFQALLDYLPKLAAPTEQAKIFPWKNKPGQPHRHRDIE
jgi:hypothetical protein